jgi:hypothetical protein
MASGLYAAEVMTRALDSHKSEVKVINAGDRARLSAKQNAWFEMA